MTKDDVARIDDVADELNREAADVLEFQQSANVRPAHVAGVRSRPMNTKVLLTASALFLAACGIAGTFLPQEILAWLGIPTSPILTIFMQLLAALLLAFGMLNWTAKDSLIGGIYNRPVAIGNLVHFLVGALALAKAAYAHPMAVLIAGAVIYAIFAIGFAMVMFGSPVKPA
jgi:hypothetical protein